MMEDNIIEIYLNAPICNETEVQHLTVCIECPNRIQFTIDSGNAAEQCNTCCVDRYPVLREIAIAVSRRALFTKTIST